MMSAHRGKGSKKQTEQVNEADTSFTKKRGMTWAQRLKRVFNIDIEVCDICGKKVKVIACIEAPAIIKQILEHLKKKMPATIKYAIPEGRSSPQSSLFTE